MSVLHSLPRVLLLALVAVPAISAAGPVEDLLPPAPRQIEKRALGNSEYERQRFDRGRLGAAFSPDGARLALAIPGGGQMHLWEVATGKDLGAFGLGGYSEGMTLAFAPDGKTLLTTECFGHNDIRPVLLWDVARRERLRALDEEVNDQMFTAMAFAPDGRTVALGGGWNRRGGGNQGLFFWDVASGDEVRKLDPLPADGKGRGPSVLYSALCYSPDGRSLAIVSDGKVSLLEVGPGKVRATFPLPPTDFQPEQQRFPPAAAVAFAQDGRTLAVGCPDGSVRRWDLKANRELPPLGGHAGPVLAISFSADGKMVRSVGADLKLFAWSTAGNRDWKPKSGSLSDGDLETLWDVLRSDDPVDLFGCTRLLAAEPTRAVALLRKHVAPVPRAEAEKLDKLVACVQSPEYNQRKRAVLELRRLGPAAVPALRRAMERGHDEMVRRLYFELGNKAPSADSVREARAVTVLEQAGGVEARRFLEELAGGAPEAALTAQARAALERVSAKAEPASLGAATLDTLWDDLAKEDSPRAYQIIGTLANRADAVPFLRARLTGPSFSATFDDDPARIGKLITDLDHEDFETRENAAKGLTDLGRVAQAELKKALENKPSAEAKRRLQELLAAVAKPEMPTELQRFHRACEALELAGGADARAVFVALAKESRVRWMREEAERALKRLGR
jgi:hypothetical protein